MTGWGTPHHWMGFPHHDWMGHPHPPTMTGWGTPHHDWMGYPPSPTSIASTCYPAGGMPLAFTQEDFLVYVKIITFRDTRACCLVNVKFY